MQVYIDFFMQHWTLSSIFVVILLAIIVYELRDILIGAKRLTPQEVVELMNHHDAIVVDIRESEAFKRGHIIHSLNVPSVRFDQDVQQRLKDSQNKIIILVCGLGYEAPKHTNKLKLKGFEQVKVLAGGIKAWQDANFPLEMK